MNPLLNLTEYSYINSVVIVMYLFLCVLFILHLFFSVITEVGSKKDQDHPAVAGLESKWYSRRD